MKLTDIFPSASIAESWTESANSKIPFLGNAFFGRRKKAGLDLSWIVGANRQAVSLSPSAFDAKAKFRDRIGVSKIETEMPFFREGFLIKEKDRQEMLRALDSNDPYVQPVLQRIFDDAQDLISSALVVQERMIWQLLTPESGIPGISIVANGMDYTYEYDKDNLFKGSNFIELTGTDKWDDPTNSKPLNDFRTAKQAAEKYGVTLAYAVMRQSTFDHFIENEQIRSAILAQNATANIFLDDDTIRQFIARKTGITPLIYEKTYENEYNETKFYVPEGIVGLLPADIVMGDLWMGTSPEEADLLGGAEADVTLVETGVAVTRILRAHPVNIEIYASEIVLPSFENMLKLITMKVA